ncbi:DUF397 domain-containing protein [Micromonospora marina]|uniref:DUF397 domain-containing protein n=1 Tax=Micromonospora marina TaxID=307120 RepID=UPI003455DF94
MPDLSIATWRKSTRSNNGGDCIEVADNLPDIVGVRDSKNPTGPALTFEPRTWEAFVSGVKQNSYRP